MSPSRDYHVGRDPESDVVIDDIRVSWHHAILHTEAGHWTIEDEDSTNGTYTGGRRIRATDVGAGSEIRFGNPSDGPRAVLLGREPPAPAAAPSLPSSADRPSAVSMPAATGTFRQPTTVRPLPAKTVRIGRDAGNDLVKEFVMVDPENGDWFERKAGDTGDDDKKTDPPKDASASPCPPESDRPCPSSSGATPSEPSPEDPASRPGDDPATSEPPPPEDPATSEPPPDDPATEPAPETPPDSQSAPQPPGADTPAPQDPGPGTAPQGAPAFS